MLEWLLTLSMQRYCDDGIYHAWIHSLRVVDESESAAHSPKMFFIGRALELMNVISKYGYRRYCHFSCV